MNEFVLLRIFLLQSANWSQNLLGESRCCRLDLLEGDPSVWDEIESKIVDCIRNTLDRRVQYYEEEVRKLSENRFMPDWDFCNYFIVKVMQCIAMRDEVMASVYLEI